MLRTSLTGINIWIAVLWLFNTPLLELLTYIAIWWFMKQQKSQSEGGSHAHTNTSSIKSTNSANNVTDLEAGVKKDDITVDMK
jgi:hypothetical protein